MNEQVEGGEMDAEKSGIIFSSSASRDKYGEIRLSLADGCRGVFQNILGEVFGAFDKFEGGNETAVKDYVQVVLPGLEG